MTLLRTSVHYSTVQYLSISIIFIVFDQLLRQCTMHARQLQLFYYAIVPSKLAQLYSYSYSQDILNINISNTSKVTKYYLNKEDDTTKYRIARSINNMWLIIKGSR